MTWCIKVGPSLSKKKKMLCLLQSKSFKNDEKCLFPLKSTIYDVTAWLTNSCNGSMTHYPTK